jgi:hypothetical protein
MDYMEYIKLAERLEEYLDYLRAKHLQMTMNGLGYGSGKLGMQEAQAVDKSPVPEICMEIILLHRMFRNEMAETTKKVEDSAPSGASPSQPSKKPFWRR